MVSPSNQWNYWNWLLLKSDPQLIENRARQSRDHILREGLKKEKKEKFSEERLCLLTCLLMGDPAPPIDTFYRRRYFFRKRLRVFQILPTRSPAYINAELSALLRLYFHKSRARRI